MSTWIHRAKTSAKPILRNALSRFHLYSTKQSIYPNQLPLFNLLQRYGFPPSKLQSFIASNHFLLNSNLHDVEKSLSCLLSFKIPHKSLIPLISDCPAVLNLDFLKKWEVGFAKFGSLGCSPMVVLRVLEYSRRFEIDPDGFFESLMVLSGLGFSEVTLNRVLEGFPKVITLNEIEISRKIDFFIGMGIARDEVDRVFGLFPQVLGYGVESWLMPLIDEFENLGFGKELVRNEIVREPLILGMERGEFSRSLELLRSLKCREPIKFKIFSNGMFRAGFEVKLRVDCLCKHGLIRREAFNVLWKEPRVIIYDIVDIEKKIEFLLKMMGFNVCCLVEVPEYLGVSFEKQILPRYKVIQHLLAKGGLGDEVTLKGIIKLSRLRFYNMYVKPYPECEKMFGRFSGDTQVKSQHPVGLWKLFKAQREPESKEDVKNIKSFMEGLV